MKWEKMSHNDDKLTFYETLLGVKLHYETINPQYVLNDHLHYQRFIVESRVQELVKALTKEYKENHSAILGKRKDGYYFCLNGQHHTNAAQRLNIDLCEYMVFDSLGWEHEKELFDKFQHYQLSKDK
jgi:hypothetical protein